MCYKGICNTVSFVDASAFRRVIQDDKGYIIKKIYIY